MAAGWSVWKDYAIREPPKYVLDYNSKTPIDRDYQLRWWFSAITSFQLPEVGKDPFPLLLGNPVGLWAVGNRNTIYNIPNWNQGDIVERTGLIQGKRENNLEKRLIQWICKVTGEKPPANNMDFGTWLKDGYLLCKLMNIIQPDSIKRVHHKGEYALRENVANFLSACRKYGLREEDCFCCTDLCDCGDLSLVAATLFSLADLAHSRDKNFPLP